MNSRSRSSSSLTIRSITLFAAVAPVFASLLPIAFATTWDPNNNPTWTSGSATLSVDIIGGTPTQTGGDISSPDLIQFGGASFGALYTIGGGTFTVGGIWVGRIGQPPNQFVQNAGTVTVSQLEITDGNGKYILNGGTLNVNHVSFDYPGAGIAPGGSLVLNGGTLVTSTIALKFGSGYVGRFYFNGGTLQADPAIASSSLGWIQNGSGANSLISVYVGQNGGQLDTNGTDRIIYTPFLHDPAATGTDGGITKLGAGTLTLAGDNTYTGPTTVSAGTLQIGNGGATGSILGNATNNATLIFNRGDAWTYGGVISGTGNLVKNGGGTLTLAGSSTFTGGTTVNAGTLKLTAGGSVGTIRGALTINPGTVVETATTDAFGYATGAKVDSVTINGGTLNHTVAGDIGWGVAYTLSNGALLSSNGGVSDASAASMFAFGGPIGGNTSVNVTAGVNTIAGHVDLRGDSDNPNISNTNVNFTVASGATLNVTAGISSHVPFGTVGPVGITKLGAGLMTLTGTNTYTGATIISAGTLQIGNGGAAGSVIGNISDNAALVFNRTDAFTYSGIISGTGSLTQAGTGALTLSNNQTYTGLTTLTNGTLRVNGALASTAVSVQSGATLGGTGTLASVATLHIGGHLAPGGNSSSDTPGTLTFTGGVSFESGAALDLQLGTASDLVRVSGGTLTGPATGALTLNIFDSGGFGPGTYPLFDYTGATLASFDATDFSLGTVPAGFDYAFATQGNQLDLIVTVPEPGVAALLTLSVLCLPLHRRRQGYQTPQRPLTACAEKRA
ncbi:autotransporter-associated beta strand repeat protein [Chthoniobacter flavus Ellin428]|uniref:Autotransporter-associated beta strand repeat protein n=1 Tax=Chthoniobacter flavus Ellin428 TaxID=497964 RepID=B4D0Y6_9BACT|nr:autotransporter-associated beta strand repeat-containing protein [Chthoniobacter flavus]EDY19998.1 autotransporter-associated beta strand repeat protein [Chthoniobacter flavus Ellin428]TCO91735.1 autotransporter-associated beta strand protein [Chthoniobacter flavus]